MSPFSAGSVYTTWKYGTGRSSASRSASHWIGQDVVHDVVGRQSPHDAVRLALARLDRQLDAFLSQPDVHLSSTLQLGELGEDQLQGVLPRPSASWSCRCSRRATKPRTHADITTPSTRQTGWSPASWSAAGTRHCRLSQSLKERSPP